MSRHAVITLYNTYVVEHVHQEHSNHINKTLTWKAPSRIGLNTNGYLIYQQRLHRHVISLLLHSYLSLLARILSTLFACASKYLQHVSVYLHAFVQLSSLLSASLIL
jgi:hypothetical protein